MKFKQKKQQHQKRISIFKTSKTFYSPGETRCRGLLIYVILTRWLTSDEFDAKGFLMVFMIHLNLMCSPDDTDSRFSLYRATMLKHYTDFTAEISPIFAYLVGRMIDELDALVVQQDGETLTQAVVAIRPRAQHLQEQEAKQCNMARFNGVAHDGLGALPHWSLDLFETCVICIEYDMIPNKALSKIALLVGGADPASNPDATSKNKLCAADRTIRSCGANACVIDLYLMSDDSHKRVITILLKLYALCLPWSGEASRETRNTTAALQWFKAHLLHGVNDHCYAIIHLLEEPVLLWLCLAI